MDEQSATGDARSSVRHMTILAQDPSIRRDGKIITVKVAIPAEDLRVGPMGHRVQLVDYDATRSVHHGSHALPESYEDEPAAWRAGDPAIVKDFRFHAQNTYALVMRTLARFEFALGRRVEWSFETHQLKVAPHGMADANAYYSPDAEGLVFGYFDGASGTPVYTCLSHDIVVHEATHALLDALRGRYMDASTPDQGGFHEGFADVVALLSVFSLPDIVEHLLAGDADRSDGLGIIKRADVLPEALRQSALFGLADEMGSELEGIRGRALRHSASLEPDPALKDQEKYLEPHNRGELFVASVLHGFIKAWSDRVIGSGVDGQKSFPVRRVAEEGADIADALATMWIRAIDYMPPVHLEFGDALSAALTADLEVRPNDSRYQLRRHMLEAFGSFGFEPSSKRKDPPGVWSAPPDGLKYDRVRAASMRSDPDEIFRFIWENRGPLRLRDGAFTKVLSVRPTVRTGSDGMVVHETVAEYYQVARLTPEEMADKKVNVRAPAAYLRALQRAAKAREEENAKRAAKRAAKVDVDAAPDAEPEPHPDPDTDADAEREMSQNVTPLYGGGVLIFDEYGHVKYWVHNDIFGRRQARRLSYLWEKGILQPGRGGSRFRATRISTIHRLRALGTLTSHFQEW